MQDEYEMMIRSIAGALARELAPFSGDEDFTERVTRAVEAHLRAHPPAAAIEIGILTTI